MYKVIFLAMFSCSLAAQCGPPNYACTTSRTDAVQTPVAPFVETDLAGTVRYDTSLNASGIDPILELSDSTSVAGAVLNTSQDGGDNGEQGSCAGRTDTTTDCRTSSIWLVSAISGGCTYVEAVSTITKEPSISAPFPKTGTPNTGTPCGDFKFSHQGNWVGYKITEKGDPLIYKVDLAWDNVKGNPVSSTQTVIMDTDATCPLPAGFSATWVGELSFDITDRVFWFATSNTGGQGSQGYQVWYDSQKHFCSVVNLTTGIVTCKGTNCPSTGALTNGCHGMSIHNSNGLRNGKWVVISGASTGIQCGNTNLFWSGGTEAVGCSATSSLGGSVCEGHDAHGYDLLVEISNPNFYLLNPAVGNTATAMVPFGTMKGNIENHFSWRNVTSADNQAIVGSSANPHTTWTEPGQNENYALELNGTLKRFGHNFILGDCSRENFEACYGIGNVSQSGRYWTWVSSMMCGLGTDAKGFCKQRIYLQRLD